ncbi:hypothetical protein PVAR5_2870 [Paecilomyces variotii No. 5]|uniref:Uncharacterized protein n=1 Tax=Byssochlamys spectabilis (strain No. 5 / NBRC 109023) TaxID=1356009 RepID=V5FWX9_BYSSN|nr:hypothetical protein PVAR5_2870 [Paecilomyces variotii No. 5]
MGSPETQNKATDILGYLWYLETYISVNVPVKIRIHRSNHYHEDEPERPTAKMGHFSTLRKIFSTKKKKDEEKKGADSHDIHSTHSDARFEENPPRRDEESSGTDDPFAALSEVASPEPVQDRGGTLSRRRSLEDQYEENKEHARHHQVGEYTDPFENLSEVASPEPIQDRDEGSSGLRRRMSLEDRLESLERRRSRSSTR